MSPSDASLKVEGTKRHSLGAQIPTSSVQVTKDTMYMYIHICYRRTWLL